MSDITLYQAFEGFLLEAQAEGKSRYTIRNYRNTFAKVKLYITEDKPLPAVTRSDWVEFFYWIQNEYTPDPGGIAPRDIKRLSPKTVNNYHTNLKAFYTWATSSGVDLVTTHPIKQIPAPRYEKPPIETLSKADFKQLLAACDETRAWHNAPDVTAERPTATRDKAILHLLLSTGIRASELCDIQFRDIDIKKHTILVGGKGKGRSKKWRTVYFGKSAGRALWLYLAPKMATIEPEEQIYTVGRAGEERPMSRGALQQLIQRLGARAGLDKNCYPHLFRHTFATEFLRNGGDILKLKAILGHSSMEMVQRYVHFVEADAAKTHAGADPADNWRV